jgi:hypothetical protein
MSPLSLEAQACRLAAKRMVESVQLQRLCSQQPFCHFGQTPYQLKASVSMCRYVYFVPENCLAFETADQEERTMHGAPAPRVVQLWKLKQAR